MILLLCLTASDGAAQGRWLVGADLIGLASDPAFGGGGLMLGVRTSRELTLVGRALAGRQGGGLVGRGEVAVEFRFLERSARRPVPYLSVGVAGATGPRPGPFLLGAVGLDIPAARRGHWLVEGGVGGGVRAALGYRYLLGGRKRRTAAQRSRSFRSGDRVPVRITLRS
ncbi:MAG: hypothetical protein ACYC2K_15640, partial [Gemmatimonadales bacterium]